MARCDVVGAARAGDLLGGSAEDGVRHRAVKEHRFSNFKVPAEWPVFRIPSPKSGPVVNQVTRGLIPTLHNPDKS
jgi:hypothetical protein